MQLTSFMHHPCRATEVMGCVNPGATKLRLMRLRRPWAITFYPFSVYQIKKKKSKVPFIKQSVIQRMTQRTGQKNASNNE